MRSWIIGNGPSLAYVPFDLLKKETTWAVNRIWKLFDRTDWRPTNYVRCEVPEYNEDHVREDINKMAGHSKLWLQAGFRGDISRKAFMRSRCEWFETCNGKEAHVWHLPTICGYGTAVHVAIQLAIINGATSLYLLGCDLGMPDHFYGQEGKQGDSLATTAHYLAAKCSPVPITNATIGGKLEVYPRMSLWEVLENGNG